MGTFLPREALSHQERGLPIPDDVWIFEGPTPGDRDAWWSPASRVILLNSGLSEERRIQALAHECGHILLGHHGTGNPQDSERMEAEADRLAAELLEAVR